MASLVSLAIEEKRYSVRYQTRPEPRCPMPIREARMKFGGARHRNNPGIHGVVSSLAAALIGCYPLAALQMLGKGTTKAVLGGVGVIKP